jgi:hypothetical protein
MIMIARQIAFPLTGKYLVAVKVNDEAAVGTLTITVRSAARG